MTVAIQQGPQITQIYGGLGATLRAIPPVAAAAALAIGVVTGVLAVGVKNSLDSAERLRQYNIELQATGNIAATTSARLDDLVRAQATRPGAGRADTAAALGTFLGNSALESEEAVGRALAIARDLARVSGQELPAASATLNQGLDGTAAGARRLDQAYNILTASEHEQIRLLEEQGKKGDAATIVLAAMERRFKGLNEQGISPTAASLNQLGNAWTAFADKVTKSPVTQALMFGATQTLNGAAMLVGGPPGMPQATTNGPTPAEMQDLRKQLADAEGTVGRLREMRETEASRAREDRARKDLKREERELAKAQELAATAALPGPAAPAPSAVAHAVASSAALAPAPVPLADSRQAFSFSLKRPGAALAAAPSAVRDRGCAPPPPREVGRFRVVCSLTDDRAGCDCGVGRGWWWWWGCASPACAAAAGGGVWRRRRRLVSRSGP